ncbi:hypothetical protein BKE38_05085 [Pseudoroseomonas deserti]|uniref:Uncharacterized protein n=1 Tax=Teichococcus deserti TaxID=1817963 RepID=A0A1V2H6M3_9PROT|nr:hypothetical protein [Pseudoroseomonas deserti]ONG56970.1 hypothetical protein BKE38_05085 [Pseudoroseomonas deserti]
MTDKTSDAPAEAAAPTVATAPLPDLKRVLVVREIEREFGPALAPGQIAYLPADHEALKDGRAKDPDAALKAADKAADKQAEKAKD